MPSFTVYKGLKDGKTIVKSTTTKPDLTADQVLVRVTASGVCFTDIHFHETMGQDMGLGHEGAGVVEDVGPGVEELKKGDRVGWGFHRNSCGHCDQCLTGREVFCEHREIFGLSNLDQGSMASHAVWRESFLFRIPEGLTDAEAAPLMCGGATVWAAMELYGVGPTSKVGIVGVGGLGHLAIQFVAKMGAEAIVFSGTDRKKEEAERLGAKQFYAMKGRDKIEIPEKLDCLMVTASDQPNWNLYLPLIKPAGMVIPLSAADGNFTIPYLPMVMNGLTIQGSLVAPRFAHRHMLEFAARNGIKPIINEFPLSLEGIEEAFKTLHEGKMRYRGVLIPQN